MAVLNQPLKILIVLTVIIKRSKLTEAADKNRIFCIFTNSTLRNTKRELSLYKTWLTQPSFKITTRPRNMKAQM